MTVSSLLDWEIRGVDSGRGWCGEGGQKRRLLCGCSKMAAQAGKPAEELWSLGLGSTVNWCSGLIDLSTGSMIVHTVKDSLASGIGGVDCESE